MRLIFFFILFGMLSAVVSAQNVTGYNTIPEPLLFLLREPAIHDDLKLTERQRKQLVKLNQTHDATLLASRNRPKEKSNAETEKVLSATRSAIEEILTDRQRQRLKQIRYRLQGIAFVLAPEVVEALKMSTQQRQQIEKIVNDTKNQIAGLQTKINKGETTQTEAQKVSKAARTKEQSQILSLLSNDQRKKLVEVVGPTFDANQLGKVSFKAPKLSSTGEWINSKPLTIPGLKGKVVALHFWAFG